MAATDFVDLTERQENILATALSMLASAAQPSRQRGYRYDEHVASWFDRCLKGTRTLDPATHTELTALWQLLNRARQVTVEALETTVAEDPS